VNPYLVIVLVIALLAFVIYRQMRTAAIEPRQLVIFPLILAVFGFINLQKQPPDSVAGAVALAASVLTALLFGIARGQTTQIWRAGNVVMRKGTTVTLLLWIVAIVVRIVIGGAARRAGVALSVTAGEIPLFLGITLAAQNAVIWQRRQAAETGKSASGVGADSVASNRRGDG
jgi:hypothetical protein